LDVVENADCKRNYQLSSGSDEMRAISIDWHGRVVAVGFNRRGMYDEMHAKVES
jgi:hypothetical protein